MYHVDMYESTCIFFVYFVVINKRVCQDTHYVNVCVEVKYSKNAPELVIFLLPWIHWNLDLYLFVYVYVNLYISYLAKKTHFISYHISMG